MDTFLRQRRVLHKALRVFGGVDVLGHRADSNADIAVVIRGDHDKRSTVALAGLAFEVLLHTGVLIEALPL